MTVGEKIEKAKKEGVVYFERGIGGPKCTIAEYYSIRLDVFSRYTPVFEAQVEHDNG